MRIVLSSLIKRLRISKEKGAKEDASSLRCGFDVIPSY
jgi:hypothetical protein